MRLGLSEVQVRPVPVSGEMQVRAEGCCTSGRVCAGSSEEAAAGLTAASCWELAAPPSSSSRSSASVSRRVRSGPEPDEALPPSSFCSDSLWHAHSLSLQLLHSPWQFDPRHGCKVCAGYVNKEMYDHTSRAQHSSHHT